MIGLQQIIESIPALSLAEKAALRKALDNEVQRDSANGTKVTASAMIGLLSDEPKLADRIFESAMIARETRPLRLPSE